MPFGVEEQLVARARGLTGSSNMAPKGVTFCHCIIVRDISIQISIWVFQNDENFVQLDELDRITHV